MAQRRSYPTDLTDREWAMLEPLVPAPKPGGRPCAGSRREIVDALVYMVRSGEAWRLLPHDLPPGQTVYHSFRVWRKAGAWQRIHTRLREETRRGMGRELTPSGAIIDSQSVKTTEKGGRRTRTATTRARS
ncbi:MAG TPA: transposase [Ktedonobacterales bacterium]|nr:transposase [Ktedonobacterales bacterium]